MLPKMTYEKRNNNNSQKKQPIFTQNMFILAKAKYKFIGLLLLFLFRE